MKNQLLVFLLAMSPVVAVVAQQNEGVVSYDQKINMHKRIQDESMKAMMPEFRINKMQLTFKGSESLYKAAVQQQNDESESTDGNGATVRMVIRVPQNETYRNYELQKNVEIRELAGKKFLVEDTLKRMPWKLTGEMKKIQNYDCMKATMINKVNNQPIVAWFTEAIPVPSGPAGFGGLPGLILEVDVNDGDMTYLMTKVDFKSLTNNDLKAPSGGKKITDAEFTKKRDEYMKEMGASGGGIRIIRN